MAWCPRARRRPPMTVPPALLDGILKAASGLDGALALYVNARLARILLAQGDRGRARDLASHVTRCLRDTRSLGGLRVAELLGGPGATRVGRQGARGRARVPWRRPQPWQAGERRRVDLDPLGNGRAHAGGRPARPRAPAPRARPGRRVARPAPVPRAPRLS